MNRLKRMWREFQKPQLKCGRIGCKTRTYFVKGYEDSQWSDRCVAYSAVARIVECIRCGKKHREIIKRRGVDSLTLNSSLMEELDSCGWVTIRELTKRESKGCESL